jgi:MraZ protein
VFLGTHEPKLDEKGRMTLPAKFRDELAGGLVITRGQERCLNVWPRQQFAAITAGLGQGGSVTRKDLRDYQRVFLSGASDDVPDRQGRVTIPPLLRSYAGLDRDLAVIGAGDRVEVWDAGAWHTYLSEQEDSFASLSEEVLALPMPPST